MNQKGFGTILLIILGLFLIIGISTVFIIKDIKNEALAGQASRVFKLTTSAGPSPSPYVFTSYAIPKIEKKDKYTIFLLGDSMTHALGPHGGTMHGFINELYKKHNIYIDINNYAKGANNILSAGDELNSEATYWDAKFAPAMSRDFDLILVESFGYNPLSQFGLEGGLKKQTEALGDLMKTLITTKPNAAIVFVATIAPSKEKYAQKVLLNIPAVDRARQAEERIAYIKNHIDYAKTHNIPVINVYEKSLDQSGNGNIDYINSNDFIHPSPTGIYFISQEIADFIQNHKLIE